MYDSLKSWNSKKGTNIVGRSDYLSMNCIEQYLIHIHKYLALIQPITGRMQVLNK